MPIIIVMYLPKQSHILSNLTRMINVSHTNAIRLLYIADAKPPQKIKREYPHQTYDVSRQVNASLKLRHMALSGPDDSG